MIRWVRQKLADRRAKKEAERRAREIAIRRKVFGDHPALTPTGIFQTVKKQVDEATEASKKARETAQKILDPKK
jgi:hypothetical protein